MPDKAEPVSSAGQTPPTSIIRARYDRKTQQFSFYGAEGQPHTRLFKIGRSEKIVIFLEEGLTFSRVGAGQGINWVLPLQGPRPESGPDDKSRSFIVEEPPHDLVSLVFQLVVDTPHIRGLLSPPLYLVEATFDLKESLALTYDSEARAFTLTDAADVVLEVRSQQLLMIPAKSVLTFDLQLKPTARDVKIGWPRPPAPAILWNYIRQPDWVTCGPPDGTQMTMSLESPPPEGGLAGFQFVITVSEDQAKPYTVRSPDPILVNTTIGD